MKMYSHRFNVRGAGLFPMDILRCDRCTPLGNRDVSLMCMRDPHNERELTLMSYQNFKWKPTEARWKSFGWVIVSKEKPRTLA